MGVYVDIYREYLDKDNKWRLTPLFKKTNSPAHHIFMQAAALLTGQSWLNSFVEDMDYEGIAQKVSHKELSEELVKEMCSSHYDDEEEDFNPEEFLKYVEFKLIDETALRNFAKKSGDSSGWIDNEVWDNYQKTGELNEEDVFSDYDFEDLPTSVREAKMAHCKYRSFVSPGGSLETAKRLVSNIDAVNDFFFWDMAVCDRPSRLVAVIMW